MPDLQDVNATASDSSTKREGERRVAEQRKWQRRRRDRRQNWKGDAEFDGWQDKGRRKRGSDRRVNCQDRRVSERRIGLAERRAGIPERRISGRAHRMTDLQAVIRQVQDISNQEEGVGKVATLPRSETKPAAEAIPPKTSDRNPKFSLQPIPKDRIWRDPLPKTWKERWSQFGKFIQKTITGG